MICDVILVSLILYIILITQPPPPNKAQQQQTNKQINKDIDIIDTKIMIFPFSNGYK